MGNLKAFVILGDTESHHLKNVDRAVETLAGEADFEITVVSPEPPKTNVDLRYLQASAEVLANLSAGEQRGENNHVVFYVTGHGQETEEGGSCIRMPDGCYPYTSLKTALDKIPYKTRVAVMDTCYAGNSVALFAEPKSSVVSAGSPGEQVSCKQVSPPFWSKEIPDSDKDGVITVGERFSYVMQRYPAMISMAQYYAVSEMSLAGIRPQKKPFATMPLTVHNGKELRARLEQLEPHQQALVMFSADWCGPCKRYRPAFDRLAKTLEGAFLMTVAEGVDGSESDWAAFGVKRNFPTVAFVNWRTIMTPVIDPYHPLDSLVLASDPPVKERLRVFIRQLNNTDPTARVYAAYALGNYGKKEKSVIEALNRRLTDRHPDVRIYAAHALAKLGVVSEEVEKTFLSILGNKEEKEWKRLLNALIFAKEMSPLPETAVKEALRYLEHPNKKLKAQALRLLSHAEGSQSRLIPFILPFLEEDDAGCRQAAQSALVRRGKKVVPFLVDYFKAHPKARRAIIEVVGDLGEEGKAAVRPILEEALKSRGRDFEHLILMLTFRLKGLQYLTSEEASLFCSLIGEGNARSPSYKRALQHNAPLFQEALRNKNIGKRKAALECLQDMGSYAYFAAEWLVPYLRDPDMRRLALSVARKIREPNPRLVDALFALRGAEDPKERLAVLKTLVALAGAQTVPTLANSLYDSDSEIRYYSVETLARFEEMGAEAVPDLVELTEQGDPELRAAALNAIERITLR